MNRILGVAGATAVLFMAAVMLMAARAYFWEYPDWAWGLMLVAALTLSANALARPRNALSALAIGISVLIGLTLGWPVTVGGVGWRPVWLALGIVMPLLGTWLLRSFSLAYRKP